MDEQNPLNQTAGQSVTPDPFQNTTPPSTTQPVTNLPPSPWTDTDNSSSANASTGDTGSTGSVPTPEPPTDMAAMPTSGGTVPPVPTPPSDEMQEAQWPEQKPKSKLTQMVGGVLAVLLVVGAATGAYIVSSRVSQQQAIAPTAPSQSRAGGSSDVDCNKGGQYECAPGWVCQPDGSCKEESPGSGSCKEGETRCSGGKRQECVGGGWTRTNVDCGTVVENPPLQSSGCCAGLPTTWHCLADGVTCVGPTGPTGGTAPLPPCSKCESGVCKVVRTSNCEDNPPCNERTCNVNTTPPNTQTDRNNCGPYRLVCETAASCVNGECVIQGCDQYYVSNCTTQDKCLDPEAATCTVINEACPPGSPTTDPTNCPPAADANADNTCSAGYYPCNPTGPGGAMESCCKVGSGGMPATGGGRGGAGGGGGVGGGFECAPGTVSNGRCEKNPRLRKTQANCCKAGTPTPSTTIVAGACMEIALYAKNADGTFSTTPMTQDQKNSIKVGDVIRLVVTASKANLKVKFRVTVGTTAPVEYAATGYLTTANTSAYYDYTVTQTGTIKFEGLVSTKP